MTGTEGWVGMLWGASDGRVLKETVRGVCVEDGTLMR